MCKCIVIDVEVMGVRYKIDNYNSVFWLMLRLIYCILFLFSDKKRGCVLK